MTNAVNRAYEMSNATKGVLLGFTLAIVEFGEAFGIFDMNERQQTSLTGLIAAGGGVYILLTRKWSSRRVPDGGFVFTPEE